jgi:hypothetical protein
MCTPCASSRAAWAKLDEIEPADSLQQAPAPRPRLLIIYRDAGFPDASACAAFESRLRASLEATSGATLTFTVERSSTTNIKSLRE